MFSANPKCKQYISRYFACSWLVLFIALLLAGLSLLPNLKPDTNVLNLLPQERQHPLIHQAQQQINGEWQNTVIWLAYGETDAKAVENAQSLQQQLEQTKLFAKITLQWKPDENGNHYSSLLAHRFHLLTKKDKAAIYENAQQFANQRVQLLYSPVGMQYAMTLALDPFFTYGMYTNHLFATEDINLHDDVAILRDGAARWALLLTEVEDKSFAAQKLLAKTHAKITGDKIIAAGMPLYSAYGAESAEREMSTVGTVSIVAIIAFMLLGFRSISPLLLTLLSIATGVFSAVVFCLLVFGKLHIITLVFGSSLISITVDYSFHYFCDRLRKDCGSAINSLFTILPGICLGVGSSIIAYGILVFTPFPALQQIGLFSVTGLLAAWLTVVLLFPLLSEKIALKDYVPLPSVYDAYLNTWPRWVQRYRWQFTVVVAVLVGFAFTKLYATDDIRAMQKPAANVYQQEQKIIELGRKRVDGQYFIVTAATHDALLEEEKKLISALDALMKKQRIEAYQAISEHVPSSIEQQANWQLLHDKLFAAGIFEQSMQQLSMQQSSIDEINSVFYNNQLQTLSIEQWVKNAPPQWQAMWLGCEEQCSSIVRLVGIADKAALNELNELANGKSILFVDAIGDINHMLKKYRQIATVFLAIALVVIGVFLTAFLGLRIAIGILAVPLLAQIMALSSLALMGYAISMFHVFGLLLALGISMDYSIFQTVGKHRQTVAMAVLLSLLTSLLAFGLLASSSTAFIQAFGLSLALGIFYAFMLAPLFTYKSRKGL